MYESCPRILINFRNNRYFVKKKEIFCTLKNSFKTFFSLSVFGKKHQTIMVTGSAAVLSPVSCKKINVADYS